MTNFSHKAEKGLMAEIKTNKDYKDQHLLIFCHLNRSFINLPYDLFDHIFYGLMKFSTPNFRPYFFQALTFNFVYEGSPLGLTPRALEPINFQNFGLIS